MRLPLGPLAPDVKGAVTPEMLGGGDTALQGALNALPQPAPDMWGPFPGPAARSSALPSAGKGGIHVYLQDGNVVTYVGTPTKLYKYDSGTLSFTDVSRVAGGNYTGTGYWDGSQFGDYLIMTNGADAVQYIDVETGTNFASLADSPPIAQFVNVVQDQVTLTGLASAPNDYAWSDINDAEAWTAGVDGLADQQVTSGLGKAMRWCAEAGIIVHERGVRQFVATGDVDSFQFDDMLTFRGTRAPYGVIELGNLAAWPSDDGFYLGNRSEQRNISSGVIWEKFKTTLNRARIGQIVGAADPRAPRLYWTYPTADTDYNDRIIGYDWVLNRWFEGAFISYFIFGSATAATTLEGVDAINSSLDALATSLDAASLRGGAPTLAVIDENFKLAYLDGAALAATFRFRDFEAVPGRRAKWRSAAPLISGAAGLESRVRLGRKQRLTDTAEMTAWRTTRRGSGRAWIDKEARYGALEIEIPASESETWDYINAVDVDLRPGPVR